VKFIGLVAETILGGEVKMGDGAVNNYAIIINGDTELRHLKNVERALGVLSKDGYKTHVASTKRPSTRSDSYVRATVNNVRSMIRNVKSRIDNNDNLVVYITGHGRNGKEICLTDSCLREPVAKELDALKYGRRTVVVDMCYGGNLGPKFVDDPRTLFISAGPANRVVGCSGFSPMLWNKAGAIRDLNRDGVKSWQERYAKAYGKNPVGQPLFLYSKGYRDYGVESGRHAKPRFPARTLEVSTAAELKAKLRMLRPGDYAVIGFSMSGCLGCHKYEPKFRKFARVDNGRHLFIWAKSGELRRAYGIKTVPNVLVVDWQGSRHRILSKEKLLSELVFISTSGIKQTTAQQAKFLRGLFRNKDKDVRHEAALAYEKLVPKLTVSEAAEGAKALRGLFRDKRVRWMAVLAYKKLVPKLTASEATEGAKALRGLFREKAKGERLIVGLAYEKLAPKLTVSVAAEEAKALRGLFRDKNKYVRMVAASAYEELATKLTASEAAEGAKALRGLFRDKSGNAHWMAASAYRELATKLTASEAAEGAKALRELFRDKNKSVRWTAASAYKKLIPKLTASEAAEGAKALRGLFRDKRVHWTAASAYELIAPKLTPSDATEEMKVLRRLFRDKDIDSDVRRYVKRIYVELEKTVTRPRIEIGIAGSPFWSVEAFGRLVFAPHPILKPFIQLGANGGENYNGNDPLRYGGIKAGGGLRIGFFGRNGSIYSSVAFLAGPAFTNQGTQAQFSGEVAFGGGLKISSLRGGMFLMIDLFSIGYNAILKNKENIRHGLQVQSRIAIQF
jgi:HEAT repeat protein